MDFKDIINTFFTDKKRWNDIDDKDKETYFFIFNRYMSKKYPKQAQYFNDKSLDKSTAMDIWFSFLKKEIRVPYWFWKGPTKKKDPEIKDWKVVQDFWQCTTKDIYSLCEIFPNDLKAEIKRIQKINLEQNKTK